MLQADVESLSAIGAEHSPPCVTSVQAPALNAATAVVMLIVQ
jgi:hypothetical protein